MGEAQTAMDQYYEVRIGTMDNVLAGFFKIGNGEFGGCVDGAINTAR